MLNHEIIFIKDCKHPCNHIKYTYVNGSPIKGYYALTGEYIGYQRIPNGSGQILGVNNILRLIKEAKTNCGMVKIWGCNQS